MSIELLDQGVDPSEEPYFHRVLHAIWQEIEDLSKEEAIAEIEHAISLLEGELSLRTSELQDG